MPPISIPAFLTRYGAALGAGDLATIRDCWAIPALVLSDQGVLAVSAAEEVERFFAGAVEWYRAQGLVATRAEDAQVEMLGARMASVNVRWDALDAAGAVRSSEHSRYILTLGEDDLRVLIPLSRAFFAEYAQLHPLFALGALRDEDITAFFGATVGAADGATFLAEEKGEIVGYLVASVRGQAPFYATRRVGTISGLMVHADCRRRGIGARLMAAALAWFAERDVAQFTLYTAAANEGALAFYRSQGLESYQIVLVGEA